ncbi:MAG: hypothetical protein ACFFDN_14640 [Candidatus Hodarchaeota archaeon]
MVLHKQKIPLFAAKDEKKEVIEVKRPQLRVLFDETREPNKWVNDMRSRFLLILTSNNFTVNRLTQGPINYTALREFDIFVMGASSTGESTLSPTELRTLGQFVQEGRGLLLVGNQFVGSEKDYNFALANMFGLSFHDVVEDEKFHANPDTDTWSWAPILNLIVSHPITKDVYNVVFPRSASLTLSLNAEPIVFSNTTSNPPCAPVMGITQYGKGKVVALGSEALLTDDEKSGVPSKDNEKLILNLFNWYPSWKTCPNCNFQSPPSTIYCPQCKKQIAG